MYNAIVKMNNIYILIKIIMKKLILKRLLMCAVFTFCFASIISWCTNSKTSEQYVAMENQNPVQMDNSTSNTVSAITTDSKKAIFSQSELFTDRDLEQTPDLDNAKYYTVSDGEDITITDEWVYVLKWTAKNVTVFVEDFQKHIIIPRSCNILFQILLYHTIYTNFYWLFPIHTYYEI